MSYGHGQARRSKTTPEYRAWRDMKSRCQNPNHQKYKNYGGRGIKVCERWQDFRNFFADVGKRPGLEYSIDRIDNNGNYEPGNFRWATYQEQNNNRRPMRNLNTLEIPLCCRKCIYYDWDTTDDGWTRLPYCELNIFLPTKKKSCKKQKLRENN